MATFRELQATKKLKVGTYIGEFAVPGIGQILAAAGCDFAFVDMEHSGLSFETIKSLLRHLHDAGIASVVRPPSKAEHHIARACDVGAQGVLPPMLETAEQARTLANQIKYPPVGTRGAAFSIAHDDYRGASVTDSINAANNKTSGVALIETGPAVRNSAQIAATKGIDCLWLGHLDLSNSLGIPGDYENPKFKDAVTTVMRAGLDNGTSLGRLAGSPDQSAELFAQGCDFICYSGDIWLLTAALSQGVEAIRQRVGDADAGGA
jgi:2-keto-3-deoxy-L-rhamnonate aldolase RhmA